MTETEKNSLVVEMSEKLDVLDCKNIDAILQFETELATLKAEDLGPTADGDIIYLKKRLLRIVGEKCKRLEEHEGTQIVDLLQRITERGFDTSLTGGMFPVLQSLITSANITEGGQSFWSATCSMSFQLMSNSFRSSLNTPISTFSSTVSPENVNCAINAIWSTFQAAFESLPASLVKDAVNILLSLQKRINLSKIPETVTQNYLSVLCMGSTLTEMEMAPPVHGTPPVRGMGMSPPTSDSLQTVAGLSSVALLCRNSLVYHLRKDTYTTLYYLRFFLHTSHAQAVSVCHQQQVQQVAMKTPNLSTRDIAVIRGSIAALRMFVFETAKTADDLSVKELLVILSSLRYALVAMIPDITLDITSFLDQLLRHNVAHHLESHWYTITHAVSDLIEIFFQNKDLILQSRLSKLLSSMHSLQDTMELNQDRDLTVLLIDSFSPYLDSQVSMGLISYVVNYQLTTETSLPRINKCMSKYLLGESYSYAVKTECLKVFRKMQPHVRTGWLNHGLLLLVEKQSDEKNYTFVGWDESLAADVIVLFEEYLSSAFLEGNSIEKNTWTDLIKTCADIILHPAEGTSLSSEKRLSLCDKMIVAAIESMAVNAHRCLDIWTQLVRLLDHPSLKIQSDVFDYFTSLRCNEDFEVTSDKLRSSTSFTAVAVAREVAYSIEVQFSTHVLLSSLNSKLSTDPESFSSCLKVINHYLQNCYFIAADPIHNAPVLLLIVNTLLSLVSDKLPVLMKSSSSNPLQEILSTIVAIIPYVSCNEPIKEDLAVSVLQFLTVVQQKVLETTVFFPIQCEATASVLGDLFSAIHVVVIQFLTTENITELARVKEAASDMMTVLCGTVGRITSIADKIREPTQQETTLSSPSQQVPVKDQLATAVPVTPITELSTSISSLSIDNDPPPFPVAVPQSASSVQCKQCVVNIITLIHSLVTSPLVDDRTPNSQISHTILFQFTESAFQFLIDVIDSTQFEHRIHFLAHLTVAEMLQHNKRGMFSPSSRQALLLRLSSLLKPNVKPRFSRKPQTEEDEARAATNRELVKATMDLAWRMFYLGSADAYPHWDVLTEAIFANGETQCWAIQGPHAPCIITTTTGSSQHMLVTIRSLTATNCWCCILHNKPTLPPFCDRPYIPATREVCEEEDTDSRCVVLPHSTPSVDLLQDHDDEMRGLIPLESSHSSLQVLERDEDQQSSVFKSLTDQETDSLRSSPQVREIPERKKQSSVCSNEDLRDSPIPPSPNRIGSVGKFAPIAERRDRQSSPNSNIAIGSKNESFSDELSASSHGRPRNPPSYQSPQPPRAVTPPVFAKPGLEEILANTIHGAFILSMFKMSPAPQRLKWDEALLRSLQALDKVPCKETHKYVIISS